MTLAILGAILAGAGYGWWRANLAGSPVGSPATPPHDSTAAPAGDRLPGGSGPGARDGAAGPGEQGDDRTGSELGAGSPLWPALQPIQLAAGGDVHPRPVLMPAEGRAGALVVQGDRLMFARPDGQASEVFRLPGGHRWASALAPSPRHDAVAFATRAEAGTLYLWVVQSDLDSTPYALPGEIRLPTAVAWADLRSLIVGDPPYRLDVEQGRWSRLPGTALLWAGSPSPGGLRAAYTARVAQGGTQRYRLYLFDAASGEATPAGLEGEGQVAYPGPWLDDDRLLVGLGPPPSGEVPVIRRLGVLHGPGGRFDPIELPTASGSWQAAGISPDGKWLVVAFRPDSAADGETHPGGTAWQLVDLATAEVRALPVQDRMADATWSAEDGRLYYLRPAGGRAMELAALSVPGGTVSVIGRVDPGPATITRLLGVNGDKAWLELQEPGSAPVLAVWDPAGGLRSVLR